MNAPLVVALDNDLSAIETARLAVLDYLAPFHVDAHTLSRIEVILEEIVSNVVRHGEGVTAMTLLVDCRESEVNLALEDDGAAFDPVKAPAPTPFVTLAEAKMGGLGIDLVKKLARELRYERTGAGGAARNRLLAIVARIAAGG